MHADITTFFDEATSTVTYLVADPDTSSAAIIDPVLDYDPRAGHVSTVSADRVAKAVTEKGLRIEWLLETHVHADHLSAALCLKDRLGGRIGIGEHIRDVQVHWSRVFGVEREFPPDRPYFDHLFRDGELIGIGVLPVRVLHTPGHTAADVSFLVGDAAFVGDTLFMPDYGTARTDFPGGNARTLYRSIRRILDLPPKTRVFTAHDYLAPGRDRHAWESTVAEQRASNVHVHDGVSEDDFAAMRTARDATLGMPTLLLPSVQVNMRGGRLPPPEENGVRYLKIPLNAP